MVTEYINNLYNMLKNYEVDLVVSEGQVQDENINSLLLDTDSLVLVLSSSHPLAKKNMITVKELKELPLILRSPSSDTRNLFRAHLESHNMSLDDFNVILEIDNIGTIKNLVRREIGASILSRSVCLDELKKGILSVLPIENLSMVREINVLYHHDFRHEDLLQNILKEYNKMIKNYST